MCRPNGTVAYLRKRHWNRKIRIAVDEEMSGKQTPAGEKRAISPLLGKNYPGERIGARAFPSKAIFWIWRKREGTEAICSRRSV